MAILSVNAGSSTLKFSLYPLVNGDVQPQMLSGVIEGLEPGGLTATLLPAAHLSARALHAAPPNLLVDSF